MLAATGCALVVTLMVAAQGGTPTITVTRPAQGATVPSGIVVMEFAAQNFTLGDQGQTHLHFYVDADPVRYDFYNGASGNPDQGVQQNGLHTHFVHWASPTSIQMFGVAPGVHSVRFVLAQANHSELTNPEATQTRNFSVSTPPAGEFTLQSMLTGLNFPLAIAFAPDGRLFYNEWTTGRIRVVQPNFGTATTFYTVSNLVTGGERGLLGLALDPSFATNHFVYTYYTTSNPLRNRIIRLTDSNNTGTNETVIVDNLPASSGNHNGGVIQFGPDGKLYAVLGDVENTSNSQNTTSLAGKILRYNKDGTIPSGNPFGNSPVWAYGIRNSFGFTFHPHTGDLWETENGPAQDDEVNRIVPGGNYGWPTVTGITGNTQFIDPIVAITPTIAPTGIVAVGENSNYPARYHNNLLFTDFNTGRVRRIVLTGAGLTQLGSFSVAFNGGQGALLDIDQAPDGWIYISSDSGIFRLNVAGDSTAPVISGVAASNITANGATISWTTNEASDTQVEYGTSTSYGSTSALNATLVTSHSQNLSGLTAGTLYHYRVRSRDAAGNLAISGDFTFATTGAPPDTTPPAVSITAPAGGTRVRGTINVTANASDNVGVAGVQFRVDGANLGAEDTAAPYQVSWNTATASNGSHTLTAVARDAAGNSRASSGVTVTVDNAAPAISGVAASNITSSSATISWTTNEASDTQVEYGTTTSYGSTSSLNAALVTSHSQSISGLTAGTLYHYRVRSQDAAGNLGISGDFTFTTSAATAQVTLAPSSANFNAQMVNTSSSAQNLTLTNSGGTAVAITGISFTGAQAADFSQTNTCGASLAANSNCSIRTTFRPGAIGTRNATLQVAYGAAGSPRTASLTGLGVDFSLVPATGAPTSVTIAAGQTASFNLRAAGTTGFTGTVAFACTGAPSGATCSVTPPSVALNGTTPAAVSVSIATTARTAAELNSSWASPAGISTPRGGIFMSIVAGMLGLAVLARTRKPRQQAGMVMALLVVAAVLAGCTASTGNTTPSSPGGGTPPGTSTITVTATSGGISHAVTLTLRVN